jgi:hypothetical protein
MICSTKHGSHEKTCGFYKLRISHQERHSDSPSERIRLGARLRSPSLRKGTVPAQPLDAFLGEQCFSFLSSATKKRGSLGIKMFSWRCNALQY